MVKDRVWYLDHLRVLAIMAVVILHVAAGNWGYAKVDSFAWQAFNFFDSIVRWGVPVFVMISGALFLNRDVPIKTIYSKYVLRMGIAYLVWATIYMLLQSGDFLTRVTTIIKGNYHMWFIPMIMGLYMFIPIIRKIVEDKKVMKYFLTLSFIFVVAIPFIINICNDFCGESINTIVKAINSFIGNANLKLIAGYTSYFILGYYLNKCDLSKKTRIIIYILGILGFIMTIGLDSYVALKTQKPCKTYYSYFSLNVMFEAIALFVWFKYSTFKREKINKLAMKLSMYGFGVYLMHPLVIKYICKILKISTFSYNPALSVLFISFSAIICSFIISAILNHIPIIKKYIV